MTELELYHHGIKGQKWGVRRYRNEDGSYTEEGLRRYSEYRKQYDEASTKRNEALKSGNSKDASKYEDEMVKASEGAKRVKRGLKSDKLADQGKRMAGRGQTITGRNMATSLIAGPLGTIGAGLIYTQLSSQANSGEKATDAALLAIGAASIVASGAIIAVNESGNRKLRAYYNHRQVK